MSETTYMLVVPPSGEIEQIEMPTESRVFEAIQRNASSVLGESSHVKIRRARRIDGVMLFFDDDATARGGDDRLNERASTLGEANLHGPVVVTGWDERQDAIPGLSLERAVQVRKLLDGAG